jgi:chromosome segregation ATPase
MENKQEQRDQIQRTIRELETELTGIDLQLGDWNTERAEQLEKETRNLRLELDELSTNQD